MPESIRPHGLGTYAIDRISKEYFLTGGPELCNLPVLLQCFHPAEERHLLRLDGKEQLTDGRIRLRFGMGRPITDIKILSRTFGGG